MSTKYAKLTAKVGKWYDKEKDPLEGIDLKEEANLIVVKKSKPPYAQRLRVLVLVKEELDE